MERVFSLPAEALLQIAAMHGDASRRKHNGSTAHKQLHGRSAQSFYDAVLRPLSRTASQKRESINNLCLLEDIHKCKLAICLTGPQVCLSRTCNGHFQKDWLKVSDFAAWHCAQVFALQSRWSTPLNVTVAFLNDICRCFACAMQTARREYSSLNHVYFQSEPLEVRLLPATIVTEAEIRTRPGEVRKRWPQWRCFSIQENCFVLHVSIAGEALPPAKVTLDWEIPQHLEKHAPFEAAPQATIFGAAILQRLFSSPVGGVLHGFHTSPPAGPIRTVRAPRGATMQLMKQYAEVGFWRSPGAQETRKSLVEPIPNGCAHE